MYHESSEKTQSVCKNIFYFDCRFLCLYGVGVLHPHVLDPGKCGKIGGSDGRGGRISHVLFLPPQRNHRCAYGQADV